MKNVFGENCFWSKNFLVNIIFVEYFLLLQNHFLVFFLDKKFENILGRILFGRTFFIVAISFPGKV